MIILALLFILGLLLVLLDVSILCAIGWKRKSVQATQSANYNAGLWAESEAKNAELLLDNVRLATLVGIYERHYQDVKTLAHKAIRVSAEREGLDPDEVLPDDSILNSENIG